MIACGFQLCAQDHGHMSVLKLLFEIKTQWMMKIIASPCWWTLQRSVLMIVSNSLYFQEIVTFVLSKKEVTFVVFHHTSTGIGLEYYKCITIQFPVRYRMVFLFLTNIQKTKWTVDYLVFWSWFTFTFELNFISFIHWVLYHVSNEYLQVYFGV